MVVVHLAACVVVVVHLAACVAAATRVGAFPWLEVVVEVALDHRNLVGDDETGEVVAAAYLEEEGIACVVEPLSRVVVVAAEMAKMVAEFGRLVEVVVVVDGGLGSGQVACRHWQTNVVDR